MQQCQCSLFLEKCYVTLGKWDRFMARDCALTVLSDSLVYDSEMWND